MTQPRIGFIGLGLMGSAMVSRLQVYDVIAAGPVKSIMVVFSPRNSTAAR